jgi:hypothetical protein
MHLHEGALLQTSPSSRIFASGSTIRTSSTRPKAPRNAQDPRHTRPRNIRQALHAIVHDRAAATGNATRHRLENIQITTSKTPSDGFLPPCRTIVMLPQAVVLGAKPKVIMAPRGNRRIRIKSLDGMGDGDWVMDGSKGSEISASSYLDRGFVTPGRKSPLEAIKACMRWCTRVPKATSAPTT